MNKLQRKITNGKSIKKQLSRRKLEHGLILASGDIYVRLQPVQPAVIIPSICKLFYALHTQFHN